MPERTLGDKIHDFITDLVRDGKEDTSFGLTESGRTARNIRALREDPIHTSVVESEGKFPQAIAPSGVTETGSLIRLIGGNFEISLLPHRWRILEQNGASQSVIEGELVLDTGTDPNGRVAVQTFRRAEFTTANFNKPHMAMGGIDFAANDTAYRFGMYDPVLQAISGDGVYCEVLDGIIKIVRKKGGVIDDVILEDDFDFTEKLNKNSSIATYELVYNAGSAILYQNREIIHTMRYADEVGYETVHLYLGMEIENLNGNSTQRFLKTRGFACSRIGAESSVPEGFNISSSGNGIIKHGPGIVERIVLGETGAGNSQLTLMDGANIHFGPISINKSVFSLELGDSFSDNLSFITTGAGFEVKIIYK